MAHSFWHGAREVMVASPGGFRKLLAPRDLSHRGLRRTGDRQRRQNTMAPTDSLPAVWTPLIQALSLSARWRAGLLPGG